MSLVLLFAGCTSAVLRPHDDPEDDALSAQIEAKSLCEQVVKRQLKAPETAKFTDEEATGTADLEVHGNVSSENSFGSLLQSAFSCSGSVDSTDTVHVTLESLG